MNNEVMNMKVSIIYWSGTGNTEAMAMEAAQGAKSAGAEVNLKTVAEASADDLNCDALLLGCPAMGSEELEENEFEPFFSAIEGKLKGKKVGLFGSYGWGTGDWMITWQSRVVNDGAVMLADGVTAENEPDDDAKAACRALGKAAAAN